MFITVSQSDTMSGIHDDTTRTGCCVFFFSAEIKFYTFCAIRHKKRRKHSLDFIYFSSTAWDIRRRQREAPVKMIRGLPGTTDDARQYFMQSLTYISFIITHHPSLESNQKGGKNDVDTTKCLCQQRYH